MKFKPLPPLEELKEFLDYNPDTGIFTWIKPRKGARLNHVAGSLRTTDKTRGYIYIKFKDALYRANRLAYYMHHGIDPLEKLVDHIDGDKSNNKINNLRLATHLDNQKNRKLQINSTSGQTGVCRKRQGWVSYISVDKKRIHLGFFADKEDAVQARIEAEKKYFGEFRHGL